MFVPSLLDKCCQTIVNLITNNDENTRNQILGRICRTSESFTVCDCILKKCLTSPRFNLNNLDKFKNSGIEIVDLKAIEKGRAESPAEIARIVMDHLKNVTLLDLSESSIHTLDEVNLSEVQILRLCDCNNLSNEELQKLKNRLPKLMELYLEGSNIESLDCFDLNKLQVLDLSDCDKLSNDELQKLASRLSNLRVLYLGSSNIESLACFDLNSLQALDLSNCDKLSNEELQKLKTPPTKADRTRFRRL